MQQILKTSIRRYSQKIAFETFGLKNKAAPLVIIHGLLSSKSNWREVAQNVEKNLKPKRKIYTLDLRNHGQSFHSKEMSLEAIANDIKQFLLEEKLKKICVLGYCLGGKAGAHLALENPSQIEKFIMVDSSPVESISNFEGLQTTILLMNNTRIPKELMLTEGRELATCILKTVVHDDNTCSYIVSNLMKTKSGEFQWCCNLEGIWNYLHGNEYPWTGVSKMMFNGPTLIIGSGDSTFWDLRNPDKVQTLFPFSEIEWFNCTHAIHMARPVKFVKTVVRFLNK